ncbi:hypothetical protein GCM10023196_093000 [Actinoallomurus vinaceus]|uniref:Uncharacterized protein n=1 Tax=Actinoallomurus vinaceus TaxID=1080074 RepID=A0ABP8UUU0_9ACTN
MIVYLSVGRSPFPHADPEHLAEIFGDEAERLLPYVKELSSEIMTIEIDWSTHTLDSATEMAMTQMRKRHPELSDEAIEALGWSFGYSYF